MSEDNYTDTNVQRVHWLREGDSPIPDEAVAYVEEAIEVMAESVFTADWDLADTPENFPESLRKNRESIYEAFRRSDDVLCETLRATTDVTSAKKKTMSEDSPKNNVPQDHWLRVGDSPIPNEAISYLEKTLLLMTASVTPENLQESLKENRKAIYEAFREADDVLCEALEEVLTPLAKEYAEYLYGDQGVLVYQGEVQEDEASDV